MVLAGVGCCPVLKGFPTRYMYLSAHFQFSELNNWTEFEELWDKINFLYLHLVAIAIATRTLLLLIKTLEGTRELIR